VKRPPLPQEGELPEPLRDMSIPIIAEDPLTERLMQEDLSVAAGGHTTGPSDARIIFLPRY
jgi:hypothetical protein